MEQNLFKAQQDEALVAQAVSGSENAMNELIGRYMPVAKAKAAQMCGNVQLHDFDDLSQEAMFGFLSAVYTFDCNKGVYFSTYARTCMDNRLYSVLSKLNAKKQVPQRAIVPLEAVEDAAGVEQDLETAVIFREQAERASGFLCTELSDLERDVFRLYLSGCPYSDIALRLSADEKAVDNALQRAKRKLRAALSDT